MEMKTKPRLYFVAMLASSILSTAIGCGGSGTAVSNHSESSGTPAINRNAGALSGNAAESEDPFASAKQSVAVFLDCLRRGDETTANSMLTTKAREELQKTAWVMQPLGTPDGRYSIGRAGYPYPEEKIVLVESRWQEPSLANQPELAMDIVCELYQEAEGWRICGMAVTMVGEEDAIVIDFEDGARLQQMLDIANGIGTPAVQQPNSFEPQHGQLNTQALPQFPDYPAANGSQIALPPNSGPVLR